MTPEEPLMTFRGLVAQGTGGVRASRLMQICPAWPAAIETMTGWDRLHFGTLNLDCTQPLPMPSLIGVVEPLEVQDFAVFETLDPTIQARQWERGRRHYYGAIARRSAGGDEIAVVVGQQPAPAVADRLELYAPANLQKGLGVKIGGEVLVDVLTPERWRQLPG